VRAIGSSAGRSSAASFPICVTLAGGDAEDIRDTVEINLGTVQAFSG
jgi:hypothetical protein